MDFLRDVTPLNNEGGLYFRWQFSVVFKTFVDFVDADKFVSAKVHPKLWISSTLPSPRCCQTNSSFDIWEAIAKLSAKIVIFAIAFQTSISISHPHTHTHTHSLTHTCTYTHTHARAHTRSRTLSLSQTNAHFISFTESSQKEQQIAVAVHLISSKKDMINFSFEDQNFNCCLCFT